MGYVSIEQGRAVFNFDGISEKVVLDFMKTLKLSEGKVHGLPPALGRFSLGYVEDKPSIFTEKELSRGGAFLEIGDTEAMWINFAVKGGDGYLARPFAIKVAAGKVNATSGETWSNELTSVKNDYMEIPAQKWLDGFKRESGSLVHQFVAKALGEGFTAEEQLTGKAEFGGLQIIVYPLKDEVWREMYEKHLRTQAKMRTLRGMSFGPAVAYSMTDDSSLEVQCSASGASSGVSGNKLKASSASTSMGMGLGAAIVQEIVEPKYPLDAWDMTKGVRMFVHLKESPRPKLKTVGELSTKSAAGMNW